MTHIAGQHPLIGKARSQFLCSGQAAPAVVPHIYYKPVAQSEQIEHVCQVAIAYTV